MFLKSFHYDKALKQTTTKKTVIRFRDLNIFHQEKVTFLHFLEKKQPKPLQNFKMQDRSK